MTPLLIVSSQSGTIRFEVQVSRLLQQADPELSHSSKATKDISFSFFFKRKDLRRNILLPICYLKRWRFYNYLKATLSCHGRNKVTLIDAENLSQSPLSILQRFSGSITRNRLIDRAFKNQNAKNCDFRLQRMKSDATLPGRTRWVLTLTC